MATSNGKHGSFLFKNNEHTYSKGRALVQMYRVVHQTKREKSFSEFWNLGFKIIRSVCDNILLKMNVVQILFMVLKQIMSYLLLLLIMLKMRQVTPAKIPTPDSPHMVRNSPRDTTRNTGICIVRSGGGLPPVKRRLK